MAQFHVGQRVRVIKSCGRLPEVVGKEATVVRIKDTESYWVRVDGLLPIGDLAKRIGATGWSFGRHLAPLTDPKADAFIESIKNLCREPNNKCNIQQRYTNVKEKT